MKTLGVIAGSGQFPLMWARVAKQLGYHVTAVAHRGETEEALQEVADSTLWVRVGELEKSIQFLKKAGVKEVALAGGIQKARLFVDARPDFRALKILGRVGAKQDDSLLRAISAELEAEGIKVLESTSFLGELLTPAGVMTVRPVSTEESKDIALGWRVAKEIGRLDIGQCVVIKDQTILAVEAIEGSNETIRRGGTFARGGAVVIKVSKPSQDFRFDLPAAGPATIRAMHEVGARVLAMESGMSILIDRRDLIHEADRLGISVVGVKPPSGDSLT